MKVPVTLKSGQVISCLPGEAEQLKNGGFLKEEKGKAKTKEEKAQSETKEEKK